MRRREFVSGIAAIAADSASPRLLEAQTLKFLRVGTAGVNPRTTYFWDAFIQRLKEHGFVEGQNFTFEFINVQGRADQYGAAMQGLIGRNVDIILAVGSELALKSAVATTSALPIVMIAIDYDPIARGYVTNLARPAGNVTGVYFRQKCIDESDKARDRLRLSADWLALAEHWIRIECLLVHGTVSRSLIFFCLVSPRMYSTSTTSPS
jgi:putative ABC transport system substrate-binding protein